MAHCVLGIIDNILINRSSSRERAYHDVNDDSGSYDYRYSNYNPKKLFPQLGDLGGITLSHNVLETGVYKVGSLVGLVIRRPPVRGHVR